MARKQKSHQDTLVHRKCASKQYAVGPDVGHRSTQTLMRAPPPGWDFVVRDSERPQSPEATSAHNEGEERSSNSTAEEDPWKGHLGSATLSDCYGPMNNHMHANRYADDTDGKENMFDVVDDQLRVV